MRLVLRVGGSVIASPLDSRLIREYVELLNTIKGMGHEVAVVVGGGAMAREFIEAARSLELSEQLQDEIAISVSRLFAWLFVNRLSGSGCGTVLLTVDEAVKCLEAGRIAVMGGLKPGMTTDTVAALIAQESNAQMLVKATDQEGIFDKDPREDPSAVKLNRLTYEELARVLTKNKHAAGIHQVLDSEAVRILRERRVVVVVVNGSDPRNVLKAVNGERVGTLVE